jgi:hypothetical protein
VGTPSAEGIARPSAQSGKGVAVAVLALASFGAAGYFWMKDAREEGGSTSVAPELQIATGVPEAPASEEPPIPEPPSLPSALAPDDAVVEQDAPSAVSATLQFVASVVSAKGKPVSKGGKCVVNVHVTGSHIDDVDANCGGTLLYDSRTPLNGMASIGGNVLERAKGDGWVYRAAYSDTGTRSSRNQFSFDSGNRQGSAWSDGGDVFSVELKVDEFSKIRRGAPLFDTPTGSPKLSLALVPGEQRGATPKLSGACKLTSAFVENADSGPRCKSELRCGKTVLYGTGTTGFSPCDLDGQAITRLEDSEETHEDGDPAIVVSLDDRRVVLRDSPAQQSYELVFEVGEQ